MKYTRPLLLAASTLASLISACSQPADIQAPALTPQFGGIYDEISTHVSTNTADGVAIGVNKNYIYAKNPQDIHEEYIYGIQLQLRTYNEEGSRSWAKAIETYECDESYLGTSQCVDSASILGVHVDAANNVYALTTRKFESIHDVTVHRTTLYKYDDAGALMWKKEVGFAPSASLTHDSAGNLYVARTDDSAMSDGTNYGSISGSHLSKYSSSGSLQWERTLDVGTVRDVVVSGSGSVYTLGTSGYSRHSSSGVLTWRKTGGGDEITIAGSNLFIRTGKTLRKLDGTGKQLWAKVQGGLSTMVLQNLAGDTSGNVYLSGKYDAGGGNFNAFARKVSTAGSNVWTRTYGTSAYDDARGVATISGSEVYVAGESQGALTSYHGGGKDGYLRKLSSSGSALWTR